MGVSKEACLIRSALAVACLGLSFGLVGCGGGNDTTSPTTGGGSVVKEDLVVGTGATAAVGDMVTVNYVGTFTNGRSSTARTTGTSRTPSGLALGR
jgi:hypothetical protein